MITVLLILALTILIVWLLRPRPRGPICPRCGAQLDRRITRVLDHLHREHP